MTSFRLSFHARVVPIALAFKPISRFTPLFTIIWMVLIKFYHSSVLHTTSSTLLSSGYSILCLWMTFQIEKLLFRKLSIFCWDLWYISNLERLDDVTEDFNITEIKFIMIILNLGTCTICNDIYHKQNMISLNLYRHWDPEILCYHLCLQSNLKFYRTSLRNDSAFFVNLKKFQQVYNFLFDVKFQTLLQDGLLYFS